MSDWYLILKVVHIISSALLFGTGIGTAWYFLAAHRTGDVRVISKVSGMVVKADFLFTGSSIVIQPISGLLLAQAAGWPSNSSWLVWTYGLYGFLVVLWLVVVWLQIDAHRQARAAVTEDATLPARYFLVVRLWFWLGWPAFFAILVIYWLMVAKPGP